YMGLDCKGHLDTENKQPTDFNGSSGIEGEQPTIQKKITVYPQIVEQPDGYPFWQLPGHNYLRITRMLDSLRQTGHSACSRHIYSTMMTILNRSPRHRVNNTTLFFWQRTQK
ncbi:MAG: hypothetical protein ACI4TV_04350, partial [Paludibacteraceae bacterium]